MTVFWDGLAALSYTRRHISQPGEKREAGVVLNTAMGRPADGAETSGQIGRASGRERVKISVVAGPLKKKTTQPNDTPTK